MTSIANLYWILHENLLRPLGMDAWYFFPFGTMENLSKFEFMSTSEIRARHKPHVLFHFDQEPIFMYESWNEYDQCNGDYWDINCFRILANSEHSIVKKQICRDRRMHDWYFFYHGLAALDWFRDAKYLDGSRNFFSKFSSYNHLVKGKRSYRMALTARLLDLGMHEDAEISFHGTVKDCVDEVDDPTSFLSPGQKGLVLHQMCRQDQLPMVLDQVHMDGNYSAHFGNREYRLWQKSFLHVVNETVFYDDKLHLTEKVFKPIVASRPFILVAAPGNLSYLRSYGFKTFGNWIDESYDDECDPAKRLDMIVNELQKIHSRSIPELQNIYDEMRSVLEYNKQHFFGLFRELIVDELLENFDQCFIIWNNGRVDGRNMSRHPDLEAVKRILLK